MENALDKVPLRVTNPELVSAERYYDAEFFEQEKKHLWPHVWQMACRLEEIPEKGDYVEYTNLDKSVIVINTGEGYKGFHNACRHRGLRLANGPGNCGDEGFVCPFHGWRWNAKGESTFVFGREIFSEDLLDRAEIDLAPVQLDTWAGCAFINFDDDAPALRECMGPVVQRMDERHADKLKMDWWFATELPTNWKLAMEAFQEGYHVMKTHPQLYHVTPEADSQYGTDFDGVLHNHNLPVPELVDTLVDFVGCVSEGMGGGIVHPNEMTAIEKLRTLEAPDDPMAATQLFYDRVYSDVQAEARERGADLFDVEKVCKEVDFHAVEFMFPHFFLLPMFSAMASYRIRPLTPETCWFEIWSLGIPGDEEEFETPTEPTVLPYNSPDFPEIPRQDYSNLPLQQLGLHNFDYMRLSKDEEGLISNYHRLIDGYLARLDPKRLAKASQIVNSGFNAEILDIGF
ncbi:MAG: aromatic ring-hydroxylating dioxygenase subunit alpha [Novosphingobium sp.]|nr:aromatic ring-hydroxylating dioxygenase subunit alpha [Novosphingobium sp.]